MQIPADSYAPLVIHVVYRFGMGGLENGLVNLINYMPANRYRHVVVCLTRSTPFAKRINRHGAYCGAQQKHRAKIFGLTNAIGEFCINSDRTSFIPEILPRWSFS
jgi:hypothetical protein